MSGYFTVKLARNAGTKPNPHGGELAKWYCDFEAEGGSTTADVYWQRKAESTVVVGDRVYGRLEARDYQGKTTYRFYTEQAPDGAPRPGGSTGSSGTFSHPRESPDRQASIIRQVALKILAPSINETASLTEPIKETVRELEQFISEASPSASEPSSAPQTSHEGDEQQLVESLLGAMGVDSAKGLILGNYTMTLDSERQENLVKALRAQSPPALERLEAEATEWYGPLPSSPDMDEDPIPF